MEIRHLHAFVAVADLRHFGRAARRLGISQPPLSRQIQQLEAELGIKLLTRHARSVELTPEGATYLATVKPHLEGLQHACQVAQALGCQKRGKLKVGLVSSLAYRFVPRLLESLRSMVPRIEVELFEQSSGEQCRAVCEGRLDLGLVFLPVEEKELKMRYLFREPLVAMLPARHALTCDREIELERLHGEPFIMCSRQPQSGFHETVLSLCRASGFVPQVAHSASSLATMAELVAANLGVALVPQSASYQKQEGTAFRPLARAPLILEIAVVWCAKAMSPVMRLFVDHAVKESHHFPNRRIKSVVPTRLIRTKDSF